MGPGGALLLLAVAAVAAVARGCQLTAPLDLARTFTRDSIYVSVPFTPGNVSVNDYHGATFTNNDFCMGEHTGTHMDSPYHFYQDGWKIADIPIERLIANGVFLNVSEEVGGNASFRLQPEHIDRWIEQHGDFPDNAVLLISYGWAQLYANRTAYLGTESTDFNEFRYPGLSVAAAERLSRVAQLVGLGIDTPSIDASGSGDAHRILARNNVYNLEHVDLDQPCLPPRGFKLYCLPMKIALGTGAPVRIVATPECGAPLPAPPSPPSPPSPSQ